MEAPTRYLGGGGEGRGNVRIDLDHLVLLGGAGCIANLNLRLDPV